ncbi:MAG: ankyrin repeat domain-containing protein [Parachlamydia sp.]|nr:ankyrin repeat domain-containing protein [Parachlamydia sp.]
MFHFFQNSDISSLVATAATKFAEQTATISKDITNLIDITRLDSNNTSTQKPLTNQASPILQKNKPALRSTLKKLKNTENAIEILDEHIAAQHKQLSEPTVTAQLNESMSQKTPDQLLVDAITHADAATVQKLLQNHSDEISPTALATAISSARENWLNSVIDIGEKNTILALLTSRSLTEESLYNVFKSAAPFDDQEILQACLARDNLSKNFLQNALIQAANNDNMSIVNNLLKNKFSHQKTEDLFIKLAENKKIHTITALLTSEISETLSQDCLDKACTAAEAAGHTEIVTLLLAKKIDILSQACLTTICTTAAQSGHKDIVKTLLATDKISSDSQDQASIAAATAGHADIITTLLTNNHLSQEGLLQACLAAATAGHTDIIQTLLEKITSRTIRSATQPIPNAILTVAIEHEYYAIIDQLINKCTSSYNDLKQAFIDVTKKSSAAASPLKDRPLNITVGIAVKLLRAMALKQEDQTSLSETINAASEKALDNILTTAVELGFDVTVNALLKNHEFSKDTLQLAFTLATTTDKGFALSKKELSIIFNIWKYFTPSAEDLKNIAPDVLTKILTEASIHEYNNIVENLLDNIQNLSEDQITEACTQIAKSWHTNTIIILLTSTRIPKIALCQFYLSAAKNADTTILKKMTKSLSQINYETRAIALTTAMEKKSNATIDVLLTHLEPRAIGDELILTAANCGYCNLIKNRLSHPYLPDVATMENALIAAAKNGHEDIVKLLINCENTSINTSLFDRDKYYEISSKAKADALREAQKNNHNEITKILQRPTTWSAKIARFFMSITWTNFKNLF